ncbi:bifunctional diguanylate cyclase/phosphodiesterase [Phyllobacterium phragmitis]|uniref:Bifunctional diguanylate cyclase/phosphodiesterase n=1 Tax=Phyllobacterium phragmitis TaxID=2670329 RepID=A0A2S9IM17_9HYPH|nr:EAL domain-containing protein [Phyllobacterium phragmitis]PRD41571.1 bifunctional diguanylate cyclase/phosphodiesterase [Phyllobacterium phragmitis]
MLTVYNCIVNEHDLRLVFLAAAVCALASFAAVNLLRHARRSSARTLWLSVAAVSCGFGIWATHFIAMLAFSPDLPQGYDITLAALSLVIAVAMTGLGGLVAVTSRVSYGDLLGGGIVGGGIAAMHFTGMAAFKTTGQIVWNPAFVVVAIVLGLVLGAAAMRTALLAGGGMKSRIAGAALLTLAICSHHFVAMSAISILPDSSIDVPATAIASSWLAVAIALASIIILMSALAGLAVDMRSRRTAVEMDRMRKLVNAAVEGLVICDGDIIITANESFSALSGIDSPSLIGTSIRSILPDPHVRTRLGSDHNEVLEADLIAAGDALIPVELIAQNIEFGGRRHRAIAIRDLRARKAAEAHISYLAHHDMLTGLPNRRSFSARLDQLIATMDIRGEKRVALLCLDLDRFKEINDLFGHAAGDTILQKVAETISRLLDSEDMLARLGGDEFAIIMPGVTSTAAVSRLAENILDALQSENEKSPMRSIVSSSIGIAIYPIDGTDRETLLSHADTALYRSKAEGRNTYRFFEAKMGEETRERRLIEHELRQAMSRGELKLVYQPQVQIDSGEIIGFEALMRWHNRLRGDVPPSIFIPIAEESGLIIQLGDWALLEACREAASWEEPLTVAVNISGVQLHSQGFAQKIHDVLLKTGLPPHRLELEITETALIKDMNRALGTLRQVKSLGVRVAMDDFGTGYSSLSNIRAFPFDVIKIDRSFIKSVDKNAQAAAIVRAVLGLGRGLGLPVLAEGIETSDELKFLIDEFCTAGQGFHLGEPASIEHFDHIVHANSHVGEKKAAAS